MMKRSILNFTASSSAITALTLSFATVAAPAPSSAQPAAQSTAATYRPTREVLLSVGEGHLLSLPRNVADVWISNPGVADVNVNNPRQIGLFGKGEGEATVIATASDGSVVYGAKVRVSQNISSINEMLRAAMPNSNIAVTQVGQLAVLNGTVASPEDVAQAEYLVRTLLNPGIDPSSTAALKIVPVNRLKTAAPLQVMLQVKIAEVSRTLARDISANLLNRDSGNFIFGVGRGNPGDIGTITEELDPESGGTRGDTLFTFNNVAATTTIGAAGRLFGMDLLGTLNLAENDGRVRTLAEPNLTALSGETASFLAGGEFPIPTAQGINGTSIEFKQYGVSLAFTPTVLDGGRISMRVRPEVSELSSEGAIRLNGFSVPSLTTRRAETTVELGSGQSFMIGGLMRNSSANTLEKAPFLGDLPIIGSLFRSNGFRRNETELVIVVTPYLVRPVNAGQIALPTDGATIPRTAERVLAIPPADGPAQPRPRPTLAEPQAAPAIGGMDSAKAPAPAAPRREKRQQAQQQAVRTDQPSATPGFSF